MSEGSGESITKITGSSFILKGASNAEVRFLTIESIGDAIFIDPTVSPKITNVTIIAGQTGIYNNGGSPIIMNVTVNSSNNGIYNSGGSPIIMNVIITASANGILNWFSSTPIIKNVRINANVGIDNAESSSVEISNATINAYYGIANRAGCSCLITNSEITAYGHGIYIYTDNFLKIDHSVITSQLATMIAWSNSITYVGYTKLDGETLQHPGGFGFYKCIGVYNGNYDSITCP